MSASGSYGSFVGRSLLEKRPLNFLQTEGTGINFEMLWMSEHVNKRGQKQEAKEC